MNKYNYYDPSSDEDFPTGYYYLENFGKHPESCYSNGKIKITFIKEVIQKTGYNLLWRSVTLSDKKPNPVLEIYQHGTTLIRVRYSTVTDDSYEYAFEEDEEEKVDKGAYCSVNYYYDNYDSVKKVVEKMSKYKFIPEKGSSISLILQGSIGYYTQEFPLNIPPIDIKTHYGEKFVPVYNKILERLNTNNDKGLVLLHGVPGSGKAQPLYSKILTPTGWTTIKDIKINDIIMSPDGTSTVVTGVFDQGVKDIYEITFSDNSKARCCDEHLWNVKNSKQRRHYRGQHSSKKKIDLDYETLELKEIKNNILTENDNRLNYNIPIIEPLNFKEKEYVIPPYFLGLLIGDGSLTNNGSMYTSIDKQLLDYVKKESNNLDCKYNTFYKGDMETLSFSKKNLNENSNNSNKITKEIRRLKLNCKSECKFIPEEYLFGSISQRIDILQGLMDTDGTCSKKGLIVFSTSSESLKNDFINLVNSLGGTCSVKTKIPFYKKNNIKISGLLHYTIHIKLPINILPFKLKRKLDRYIPKLKYGPIRYITNVNYIGKEECRCIMVENSNQLYITDNYIVTHNTTLVRYLATQLKKEVIFLPPYLANGVSSPSFIPFLMKHKNSILIIEDAEQVLMDRQHGQSSSEGVSNILNLTDGLLSDCLNIQIICTFNVDKKLLDKALLRKGRLIAETKFTELSVEDSNNLLNIIHPDKGYTTNVGMVLTDIYNYEEINFSDQNNQNNRIGFNK